MVKLHQRESQKHRSQQTQQDEVRANGPNKSRQNVRVVGTRQVQRNVDKSIGVSARLVELPPLSLLGLEDEEEFVPDYSPMHTPPRSPPRSDNESAQPGGLTPVPDSPPQPTEPSGGLTPPQDPPVKKEFRIATFGVQKLARSFRWKNGGANAMHDAWQKTANGAPRAVDRAHVTNALLNRWGTPDVLIDARCFRPPPRDWTGRHMGFSHEITRRLINDEPTFSTMWRRAMEEIDRAAGGLTPVNIAVYCRAGEKRSVSIAWLLNESLRQHGGWTEVEPIDHLCEEFWGRKTCAGRGCQECNIHSEAHERLVARMRSLMVADRV